MGSSLKFDYNGQIRRIHVGDTSAFSFQELRATAMRLFQIPPQEVSLAFSYVDEQTDRVTLADDSDLVEAFRVCPETLKVQVRSSLYGSDACWPCGPCPRGSNRKCGGKKGCRPLPLLVGIASFFFLFGCRGSSIIGILIAAGAVGFHLARKHAHRPVAPVQPQPAPSAPAPEPSEPLYPNLSADSFRQHLDTLKDMGFTDSEHNVRLLLKHNGDLAACLGELLANK